MPRCPVCQMEVPEDEMEEHEKVHKGEESKEE